VSGAVGGLHPQAAMGPAMVVGQVVVEHALGMLLVLDDDVVEAVPAQGTDPVTSGGAVPRRSVHGTSTGGSCGSSPWSGGATTTRAVC
jgi:hypothetical protein